MTRSLAAYLIALAAASAAPHLRAQSRASEPTQAGALDDAVELRNGAYLRGLILEVDPTSHLTLKLPTGEVRRIPIGEVLAAERSGKPLKLPGSEGPSPPAAAPAPTEPVPSPPVSPAPAQVPVPTVPPAAPAPATQKKAVPPDPAPSREIDRLLSAVPGPRVKLTLLANKDAYLQRQIGSGTDDLVAYHLVCRIPCRLELPANDPIRYRIDGRRTEATPWFSLPRYDARIEADLVSETWPLWPRALLVGGTIFGLIGGGMIGGYALANGATWVRDVGIGLAATGGALFVTSGILFLVRPESSLTIQPAQRR